MQRWGQRPLPKYSVLSAACTDLRRRWETLGPSCVDTRVRRAAVGPPDEASLPDDLSNPAKHRSPPAPRRSDRADPVVGGDLRVGAAADPRGLGGRAQPDRAAGGEGGGGDVGVGAGLAVVPARG